MTEPGVVNSIVEQQAQVPSEMAGILHHRLGQLPKGINTRSLQPRISKGES